MKAKVYIETSIPSYLTARPSNDIRAMANQNATLEWWENHRENFDLFISEFVLAEASLGHPEAAQRRMEAIAGLPELSVPEEAMQLASALIAEGPLPKKAEIDAFHIAVAAVNGIEYLLTWIHTYRQCCSQAKIEAVCRAHDFEPPIICTPQELMGE